jgi:hypothetical protein
MELKEDKLTLEISGVGDNNSSSRFELVEGARHDGSGEERKRSGEFYRDNLLRLPSLHGVALLIT